MSGIKRFPLKEYIILSIYTYISSTMSDREGEGEKDVKISMRDRLVFYKNSMLPSFTPSRLEYNRAQVKRLELMPQPEQRSPEWYEMRHSMLSASDWGSILGMSKYGGGKNQVLVKKCCDDVPFFTNAAMQWGIKYEAVAIQIYEHRNQTKVIEFGCIRHPTISHLGASPDGITADGVMVEIKCPSSREIDGIIPEGYYCQVQGQLEVCELDRCDFLECKLFEYESEEDYLDDADKSGNHFYCRYGGEKGVVANFYDQKGDKKYYEYSPVGILGDELVAWKAGILEKYRNEKRYIFQEFTYWFLERVSCIPIYRNQEWFYKASKELAEFWGQVVYYRSVGPEKLKADLQKMKEEKAEERVRERARKKEEAVATKKAAPRGRGGGAGSKKITDFVKSGAADSDMDEELDNAFTQAFDGKAIHSIFSDEGGEGNGGGGTIPASAPVKKAVPLAAKSTFSFQNIFSDDPPVEAQKKNAVATPAKAASKSASKPKAAAKPKAPIPNSFLDIFTEDELKEMRK
jgi:putative phage-type endonuclease